MYSSTPTSHISSILPSYILTKVNPCGRFFVDCPNKNIDASFLLDQNSNEACELDPDADVVASKG